VGFRECRISDNIFAFLSVSILISVADPPVTGGGGATEYGRLEQNPPPPPAFLWLRVNTACAVKSTDAHARPKPTSLRYLFIPYTVVTDAKTARCRLHYILLYVRWRMLCRRMLRSNPCRTVPNLALAVRRSNH
jgi:hypothetical protein